jgi:hypothetical protein
LRSLFQNSGTHLPSDDVLRRPSDDSKPTVAKDVICTKVSVRLKAQLARHDSPRVVKKSPSSSQNFDRRTPQTQKFLRSVEEHSSKAASQPPKALETLISHELPISCLTRTQERDIHGRLEHQGDVRAA